MSLPNPSMDFTAFDVLTAAELDDLVENIEALAAGTGLNGAVITSENLNTTIACRAYRNAAQTINSASGEDKVAFDTENFDVGNNFDTSTGTFTAPTTGIYHVNTLISIADLDASTDSLLIHLKVNGTDVAVMRSYSSVAGGDPRALISDLISLTAGDTVEVYANHSSADATEALTTGSASSYVAIYFVGV